MSIEELKAENARLKADLRNCHTAIRVKEEENARLKAEVEELKLENSQYEEHHKYGQNVITSLREEVERLTKAGDGLYKSMLEIGCNEMADNFQYDAWWGSMKDWYAAKEGKQP
jgi:FtsZ-binding cell division protein ZapB